MYEFWPDLQHTLLLPGKGADAELQADFSQNLPAWCARMAHGTRMCYIRVDEVRRVVVHAEGGRQ